MHWGTRLHLPAVVFGILATGFISNPSHAATGRLIVRLEGTFAGVITPRLVVQGPEAEIANPIGALALAAGEIRVEDLEPGVYTVRTEGIAGTAEGPRFEVAVQAGLTSVLHLDLASGTLRADPFRPDPFGVDDGWDASWLEALPGAGEEASLGALTGAAPPRRTSLDGLDMNGGGFRQNVVVGGEAMARASSVPVGTVSAAEEQGTRRVLSMSDPSYADAEGATGSLGRTSFEGTVSRRLDAIPWTPQVFATIRTLNYGDATGSVFQSGEIPHNGLDGMELFARVDAKPGSATRLSAIAYGDGSSRDYYLEPFRYDPNHAPREDRASLEGTLRLTHAPGSATRELAEIGLQRTYVATGDGTYFDDLLAYGRAPADNQRTDANGLYWEDGHAYDYFRKELEVDLTARAEIWRYPGTSRASGAGFLLRRGTYRSYEHLNPIQTIYDDSSQAQAIGYDPTGKSHASTAGRKPGTPLTLEGFATARRPWLGGDVEAGVRLTRFRAGQDPVASFASPLDASGRLVLASASARTSLDPRVGFTRGLGDHLRLWLSGGGETWVPPSEALYYSPSFLNLVAYAAQAGGHPARTIFGNPGLKPERAWSAAASLGARVGSALWLRAGVEGRRVQDAITPRAYPVGTDSLFTYENGGARDLVDLSLRADLEPSPAFRARVSYDLSRARTKTVEPVLLDGAWANGDLAIQGINSREGFPAVLPAFGAGASGAAYPSIYDRTHRISAAVAVRTPADLLGEQGRPIFDRLEVAALFRAASGAPFTWAYIYPAGNLPQEEAAASTGAVNGGRTGWTGQLDLRIARTLPIVSTEAQLWFEVTNVTNHRNVLRVYQATGLASDDGYLSTAAGRQSAQDHGDDYAAEYAARLLDPRNYDEPRLFRVGVRLRLP